LQLTIFLTLNNVCEPSAKEETNQGQPPVPTITTANEFGEVIIKWSQDMQVYEKLSDRRLSQQEGL
jgi:hypothetical protein